MNSNLLLNQYYPPGNTGNDSKWLQKTVESSFPILVSTLFLVLLFLPLQNIQAQCGITPDPVAPSTGTVNIDISTAGTMVSLDAAVLSAKGIAPIDGPGGTPACQLFLNISGTLVAIPQDFTCGTPGAAGSAPFAPGPYSIVADDDGTIDANTTTAVMINVSIIDTGDPTFVAGSCTAPVGPLAGGAYSSNADALNNDDCRTAIPGLTHPGTNDNCSGEVLTVVYDNTNDPLNNLTPITVTKATTNTFEFYAGTTTVTYTVTDGNTNTAMCNFDVIVTDDEDPSFSDPSAAIQADLLDEVSVSYSLLVGTNSGRINIVLNCNSPNYAADLATASAYVPTAVDNCDSSPTVTPSGPFTAALACATQAGSSNIYQSIVYNYQAVDASLNSSLNFNKFIYTQDITPPDFNPATSAATVPAPPTSEDEGKAGTAADPYLYSGGSVTFGTSATFNTVTARDACAVDFSGSIVATFSALAVTRRLSNYDLYFYY